MKKIKSMSSVMRTSAFVGCIMIPVSFVIFLVAGFSDPEELHLFDVVVQPGMSILKRIMAMSPMAITLIFGTFVVYFLYRFFQALSQGDLPSIADDACTVPTPLSLSDLLAQSTFQTWL